MTAAPLQKCAVVIGGSRGIGHALVERLTDEFADILVLSRTPPPTLPPGVRHVSCDVLSGEFPEPPEQVHALAYCPGSITLKPFSSLKDDDFTSDWKLNVLGAARALRAFEAPLRAAQDSSVVLFSTAATATGMPYHASIASAKSAVEGLGRALAAEWIPDVRVNVVAPSLTDTELASRLLRTEKQRTDAASRHPLGRIGRAEDVAALATFLLSENSGWITGQVIPVDGGLSTLRPL